MANQFFVNVYQINQRVLPRDASVRMGFPTAGLIITGDCSNSSTRSLTSGYNVYSSITVPAAAAANSNGSIYYVGETIAQLAALIG